MLPILKPAAEHDRMIFMETYHSAIDELRVYHPEKLPSLHIESHIEGMCGARRKA